MVDYLAEGWQPEDDARWGTLMTWLFTHHLGALIDADPDEGVSREWFEAWLLGNVLHRVLEAVDVPEPEADQAVRAVAALLSVEDWGPLDTWREEASAAVLQSALQHQDVQAYLRIHDYQGVQWFHKESFESLLWWRLCLAAITRLSAEPGTGADPLHALTEVYATVTALRDAEERSAYQVDKLTEAVAGGGHHG
jgi:hypothetical protein